MCVAEYRDYVNSFSFRRGEDIKNNHRIIKKHGSFYHKNTGTKYYVLDTKRMKELALNGNYYATLSTEGDVKC